MDVIDLTQRRPQKALNLTIVRELGQDDLLRMVTSERGTSAPALKKLRGVHHRIAKLLAEGLTESNVALACNVSLGHVSILKNDPAFKGLMEHYSGVVEEAHKDFVTNLADLRDSAVGELHERLLDSPDDISNSLLVDIIKLGADRTGHGPTGKVSVSGAVAMLTASEILELKQAAKAEEQLVDVSERTIDVEAE